MWAALCALLIAMSSNGSVDSRVLPDSHAVNCVKSLRSGGRDSLRANSTISTNESVDRRTTGKPMALLLPLMKGQKRGRGSWKGAQGVSDRTRARIANKRGKVSPEAPVSSKLASLIGAMFASGSALGLWSEAVGASPFDPRPAPKSSREPFFEGWFIRLVDHEQRLSFALILGSFRSRGGTDIDQHYVSLSYLHEPKGGALPTEADNTDKSIHNGERRQKNPGDVGALSAKAGTSMQRKRFMEWACGQWLSVLRGFGAKGGIETMRSSRGEPEAGKGGHGSTARAEAPFKGSPSSRRNIGVDADVDVDCVNDEVKGPSDETEEKAAAPDDEGGADMVCDEGNVVVKRDQERRRPEGAFHRIREFYATILPGALADKKELVDKNGNESGATIGVMETSVGAGFVEDESGRPASGTRGALGNSTEQLPPQSHATMEVLNDPPRHRDHEPPVIPLRENSTERMHTFHAFPPPETVSISRRGLPVDRVPNLRDESSFTWEADGIGYFTVDGDTGRLSFQLPELSVAASFRNRQPWSQKWPNSAGPEGWLSRTRLLPLHYFVHSLGSEAGYSLKAADAPRAVVGRGSTHMENNYGTSFPTGWIWAQDGVEGVFRAIGVIQSRFARRLRGNFVTRFRPYTKQGCSATQGLCGNIFRHGEVAQGDSRSGYRGEDGAGRVGSDVPKKKKKMDSAAHFVLTSGRFIIGPATTNSFVLAFRSSRHHWDFRTTDLDRISIKVCRRENRVKIVARSWGDSRVLEADIHAPDGSFGSAIYVPTPEGFSNTPGCVESYAATATFRLYTKDRKKKGRSAQLVLREEVDFKLAALEFGGSYQDT